MLMLNCGVALNMGAARLDEGRAAASVKSCRSDFVCAVTPHLAVVIVGDDPASHVYVNNKVKTRNRIRD